uniref:Ig-like domain-containing protein n=1 Tax=Naja naja TaxID=35670 RepID=A0A8C6YJX7_NAJNA
MLKLNPIAFKPFPLFYNCIFMQIVYLFIFLISGFAEEHFVRIWPENPVVQFGGSLEINCSASIEADAIGLETAFRREIIGTGSNWKLFRLTNISDWNTNSLCYAKDSGAKTAKATITVYSKSHDDCNTPIRDLTVTLLKGEEQLLVKTFKDHTQLEAGAVVVNHRIRAQQNDYNKTITCQTSLDLRPAGPLLANTSHGISLRTFDFAKAPLLHTGLFLEAGTLMKVTCDAPEVSPADEATFDLWFAGKPLTFITTVMGGLASAQAEIASSSVGDHELICTVSLGPVTRTVKKTVNVFALPKPILQIGSSEAVVGQKVNITCGVEGSASPGFKMQILDAAKTLASSNVNEHFLHCFITSIITSETNHIPFSILDGPQMDDSSCPQIWTWKEGSTTTLTCSALGNPTATVQCWKDGRLYKIGKPQLIQIEHDGIYQCNATNQYGFDVRDVTIYVERKSQSAFNFICQVVSCRLNLVKQTDKNSGHHSPSIYSPVKKKLEWFWS